MQARYALLLTFDELSKLTQHTKTELANLDPEFAKIVGVPTAENPPAAPEVPRPTVQQGNTTVIMPERGQVNQQNSPLYNQMMGGVPGIPGMPVMPPQVAPVVPSAVPPVATIPQLSVALPPVVNPMPPVMPPQQPAAPPQAPPQPVQETAPFAGYDVRQVKEVIFPQQVMAKYGSQFAIALIQEATQHGIFQRPTLDCLSEANVNQFMHLVSIRTQPPAGA